MVLVGSAVLVVLGGVLGSPTTLPDPQPSRRIIRLQPTFKKIQLLANSKSAVGELESV